MLSIFVIVAQNHANFEHLIANNIMRMRPVIGSKSEQLEISVSIGLLPVEHSN